jgi:hypothetical protein
MRFYCIVFIRLFKMLRLSIIAWFFEIRYKMSGYFTKYDNRRAAFIHNHMFYMIFLSWHIICISNHVERLSHFSQKQKVK